MIHQVCESCGNPLEIPAEYAGKKGRCAKCGATILVQNFPDSVTAQESRTAEKPQLPAEPEQPVSVKSKLMTHLAWCCFVVVCVTAVLAQAQVVGWKWSRALLVICVVYVLVDAIRHHLPRNKVILWVLGSTILYFCFFPLYVFLRQGTRKLVAVPASIFALLIMIAAFVTPSLIGDDALVPVSTVQEKKTEPQSVQSEAALPVSADTGAQAKDASAAEDGNVSAAEIEKKLNIKFSEMAKYKIKGIYLGMNKSEAIEIMKKVLGNENVGYDESNPHMVMLSGGGISPTPSIMMFAGDTLIMYAYSSDVVDRIFNVGALDLKGFAQQFIDSYGFDEMTVDQDQQGNEFLIHRNKAGFSVTIFEDKTMAVELLENAGEPSFD